MQKVDIAEAAAVLEQAQRTGQLLSALPPQLQPSTVADAHAIQDELVRRLGEAVVGWKVAGIVPDDVKYGAILASRLFRSSALIEPGVIPLRGVEAEIAFRFNMSLPPREAAYSAEEVASAVTALPVIELVDSRFTSYAETPVVHRLADRMSNGGLVIGEERLDWRGVDLVHIPVTLTCGDEVWVQSIGGHSNGDPLLPAIAFVNAQQRDGHGIAAGQIVTTGSYTGLKYAPAGRKVTAVFQGFAPVEVTFG